MIEEIYLIIIAALPSIGSIIGVITAVKKVLDSFSALKKKVEETTDVDDLRKLVKKVMLENAELKRLIKEDIEARTNVEVDTNDEKV